MRANAALHANTYTTATHEARHFFVRDMVEKHEIEVPFVRTADNIADFFTKPMKTPKVFHAFRSIIMNERKSP